MKAVLFGVALGVVIAGVLVATLIATSYHAAAAPYLLGFLGIIVAGALVMRAWLKTSASLQPCNPLPKGISTPPSTRRLPAASWCTS